MTASQSSKTVALPKGPPKAYGRIVLTLYNCLLPDATFKETPSQADGLDIETETDLRILGCEMIQTAGILLKLPQVAMATGQIYLQRFYYSKSFVRYPMETMAMGSVYLASKVEEKPCRIRDVINVFHHIKQVRSQRPIVPLIVDQNYIELKNQVIKAERRILKELGFCVHVKHPHKLIVVYLQLLGYEKNKQLMQVSWNYMNDALRTDVFMRFQPETIACACIYLTARKISLPLPNNPHWFALFSVKEDDLRDICFRILRLYKRPKVVPEEMEKKIDSLKRIYQANKLLQSQSKELANSKGEKDKSSSPSVSFKDDKRDSKTSGKSMTPPLKHHVSGGRKSKHENRRSRSPYDRKDRNYSKRHRSRSPAISSPRRERSRTEDRRTEDKRGRGYLSSSSSGSRKYEEYDRGKSRDEKRKY